MEIRHKTVSTPDNQIDGDDWNDKHNVTPLLYGYELVEEIIAPAGSTSILFDNLNGDTDEEYLIESNLFVNAGGADRFIKLYPNGDVSNGGAVRDVASQGGVGYASEAFISIASTGWSQNGYTYGEFKIRSKTGGPRLMNGQWTFFDSNLSNRVTIRSGAFWNNSIDNITNIVIAISGGSFSGTIRLWKRIKEVS